MSTAPSPPRSGSPRERLLAAAQVLFYREGIRSVGVDRLCAEAQVSKRSLYQHFGSKDGVVTAMLDAQSLEIGGAMTGDVDSPPRDRILAVFDVADELAQSPDYHGCPFVSAATEIKDREHPASVHARQHKLGLTAFFEQMATEAGAREPDLLAVQLTLVFDGAAAYSVVRGGSTPATRTAAEALLRAQGI